MLKGASVEVDGIFILYLCNGRDGQASSAPNMLSAVSKWITKEFRMWTFLLDWNFFDKKTTFGWNMLNCTKSTKKNLGHFSRDYFND